MDIILNLKEEADWASELNKDIEQTFPEYFLSNPKLGTPEWWNSIDEETSCGRITHVGAYLEEGECLSSQGCTPLMASPITYDEQESCWTREDMVFAECMSVEMGCGHGIIHARGPDTECMMFPNMCIPINWHICTQEFPECME